MSSPSNAPTTSRVAGRDAGRPDFQWVRRAARVGIFSISSVTAAPCFSASYARRQICRMGSAVFERRTSRRTDSMVSAPGLLASESRAVMSGAPGPLIQRSLMGVPDPATRIRVASSTNSAGSRSLFSRFDQAAAADAATEALSLSCKATAAHAAGVTSDDSERSPSSTSLRRKASVCSSISSRVVLRRSQSSRARIHSRARSTTTDNRARPDSLSVPMLVQRCAGKEDLNRRSRFSSC